MFLSPHQHGFMEKRSTISNLACFTQFTSKAIDNRQQVDTIYFDFQKAFDQIDHFILLDKLKRFGFSEGLLKLFESYLFNREQYVKYRNYKSNIIKPASGVPQGSNLGPLLFLLFIDDLGDVISCQKLFFADDLKLFLKITSTLDCQQLQQNICSVCDWASKNRLSLNKDKCFAMTYSRKKENIIFPYRIENSLINRTERIKDLGILFDTKLQFIEHIHEMVSKSFRTYGFIYRNCRDFTYTRTLCSLFFSLVRSQLEYGALIWFPIYQIHIQHIEHVQRVFFNFYAFYLMVLTQQEAMTILLYSQDLTFYLST